MPRNDVLSKPGRHASQGDGRRDTRACLVAMEPWSHGARPGARSTEHGARSTEHEAMPRHTPRLSRALLRAGPPYLRTGLPYLATRMKPQLPLTQFVRPVYPAHRAADPP